MLGCQLVQFTESFTRESWVRVKTRNRRLNFRCIADVTRWTLYTYREFHRQQLPGRAGEDHRNRHSSRGTLDCRIVSCAKTPDLRTTWLFYLATCVLKRFPLTTHYFQPPENWNRRGMAGRKLYEQFMQNLERADVYGGLRVELQVADYG